MQKLRRIVLIGLGTFVAVLAVALLVVNLYVQSQGIQTRIQQELSQRLGVSVKIRQISVTPWGGLKLSGITIPQTFERESGNFLEAKTFRLRLRFRSLFARRLVIKEVALVDPRVIWPQNAEGKWMLPGSERTETDEGPRSEPSPEVIQIEPRTASAVPAVETKFVPEIRRIKMSGGNFRFLDATGKFVAAFEGLHLRSKIGEGSTLSGDANVARISLRDRFFLQRMRSILRYGPDELDLSQISAHAGGGDVTGHFAMQPEGEGPPFNVEVRFRNVEADQIIADAGGERGVVKGKLEGNFEGKGRIADPNLFKGAGKIALRDGQLRQYSLLVALGQLLQIEELTQLHLEQAEAKYHIDSGMVTVDELILRSPNIRLSAKGTIDVDAKLKLDAQLAINEKVRNQLFKPIRANFQPSSEPGYFAVDFEVGGTIDRPKSNLVDKVVGKDLKDFGKAINSFLGGGKTDRKKKSSETPVESPSPTETTAAPVPSP